MAKGSVDGAAASRLKACNSALGMVTSLQQRNQRPQGSPCSMRPATHRRGSWGCSCRAARWSRSRARRAWPSGRGSAPARGSWGGGGDKGQGGGVGGVRNDFLIEGAVCGCVWQQKAGTRGAAPDRNASLGRVRRARFNLGPQILAAICAGGGREHSPAEGLRVGRQAGGVPAVVARELAGQVLGGAAVERAWRARRHAGVWGERRWS